MTILAEDAVFSMPPWSLWWRGAETLAGFSRDSRGICPESRSIPCRVNGQPGLAYYSLDAADGPLPAARDRRADLRGRADQGDHHVRAAGALRELRLPARALTVRSRRVPVSDTRTCPEQPCPDRTAEMDLSGRPTTAQCGRVQPLGREPRRAADAPARRRPAHGAAARVPHPPAAGRGGGRARGGAHRGEGARPLLPRVRQPHRGARSARSARTRGATTPRSASSSSPSTSCRSSGRTSTAASTTCSAARSARSTASSPATSASTSSCSASTATACRRSCSRRTRR